MQDLHTIRLLLSYDGTHFEGWQYQPEKRTVQWELDRALAKVLKVEVKTSAAGRTDAGVHATGQVVSFRSPRIIPPDAWVPALNAVLPRDIAVWQGQEVSPDFHARHSAVSRSYRYEVVGQGPRAPLKARYANWVEGPLDIPAMQEVWHSLLGAHDFTHFRSQGSDSSNPICIVTDARLSQREDSLFFDITANHFLYNMVRRLIGTTLRVGRGVLSTQGFVDTWQGKTHRPSGPTAAPHGLTFVSVGYPPQFAWNPAKLPANTVFT